jgi:pimeloyl-ACP methyl ester carboxylesterase
VAHVKSADGTSIAYERTGNGPPLVVVSGGLDDGSAHLFGASSGGALALEAAAAGVDGIAKIAAYEVPYNMSAAWPEQWQEYVHELGATAVRSRRGAALELFLRLTGASDADVRAAQESPFWADSVALEHTLAYDAACLGTGQPDPARLAAVTQPTLVITGGGPDPSSGAAAWVAALGNAADAIVAARPQGHRLVLEGQSHVPDPRVLASTLAEFFAA